MLETIYYILKLSVPVLTILSFIFLLWTVASYCEVKNNNFEWLLPLSKENVRNGTIIFTLCLLGTLVMWLPKF